MVAKKIAGKVKGVARVKKFDDGKDPSTDQSDEIVEKEFHLTEEQAKELSKARATAEIHGKELKLGMFKDRKIQYKNIETKE